MAKYFECPVCIDQDKVWEELYEDEVDLRNHLTEVHARVELVEYIMEREHPYNIDDEENLTRRKIVKSSSVPERPYGKTISPLELSEKIRKINSIDPESPLGVMEENIRRIVRDEIHKVLRREYLQK